MQYALLLAAALLLPLAATAQERHHPPRTLSPIIIEPETITNQVSHTVGQAEERKFITIGMSRVDVLAKLGDPDRQIVNRVTHVAAQTQVLEPYIDIYEPSAGDSDTRTRIRYRADVVDGIDRDPAR